MKMKVMLDKGAFMPDCEYLTDAGYDLRSPVRVIVPAGRCTVIDTGVHIQLVYLFSMQFQSSPLQ